LATAPDGVTGDTIGHRLYRDAILIVLPASLAEKR
jgi:hypothetical protein